jgi:hypothetical protein
VWIANRGQGAVVHAVINGHEGSPAGRSSGR